MIELHPDIDVRPEKLVKFQGEKGPFYVCTAGGKPELENCFFYGDDKHKFFFYGKLVSISQGVQGVYDIEIYMASKRRLAGYPPEIKSDDLEYIEANIRHVFSERSFSSPGRNFRQGDGPRSINFTWRFPL